MYYKRIYTTMRLFIFFYIHRIQESQTMVNNKSRRRYKQKSKSRARSRSKSISKSRSRSRSIMGGAALVGSSWSPATNNTYRALTAPSARGNHFQLSKHGGVVGGIQPAVPEMNGPAIWQQNRLMTGGARRKRGGELFAGFPSIIANGWDNAKNGIFNLAKGFNGLEQLPPATPWDQPNLHTEYKGQFKPIDTTTLARLRAAV